MAASGIGDTFDQFGGPNQYIADANMFNDPPAPGNEFFIAWVRVEYRGSGSDTFLSDLTVNAVGDSNVGYTQFGNSCGVTPDGFDVPSTDVFTNGEVSGFVCFEIRSEDAESLLLYYEPFSFLSSEQVFFELTDPE